MVTHTTFAGSTGFFHFGLHAGKPLPPGPSVNQATFKTLEGVATFQNPYELTDVRLSSHDNQAMGAHGDSGGPLRFQTKKGLAVAGLYAMSIKTPLRNPATQAFEWAVVDYFEPLMDKLTWIRNVQQGIPGTTGILVPGEETPASTGESKEESKPKPTA
jgi:hypothetical protein